ncbi:MAG: glycoside hydrolase family 43 protein [Ignavibacteriaceae bacterium]
MLLKLISAEWISMKKFFFTILLCGLVSTTFSQDVNRFTNPILAGFYPDPSICKVGEDYYLVNSTFSYYPGIPVHHSKDLVNWKLIGYVMNRPEQMNLDSLGVSRGIFAPAIMYHDGLFYVTCTLVDAGGNFVVTAKSPEGPWSDPVWIPEVNGIDPSMFFDEDGKAYILYNSVAPDDKPLYDGHRTIRMYEFDLVNMKVTGGETILINGGTDISKKPVWIEGPHIFKKDGYYYMIAAEGGTSDQHSEVVFRSKKVNGPYGSYENNPILTQRHLDPKREFPVTSTGHADFVESKPGEWWAVFLGCRPYEPGEEGYYNTGRETFLAPVKWEEGWPVILKGNETVQYYYPYPLPAVKDKDTYPYSGNFTVKDNFDTEELDLNWMFLRTPREKWYDLKNKAGYLSMHVKPETASGNMNPAFIGRRQQHHTGSASAALSFTPQNENEKAGLIVFQNENHFYYLCKSLEGSQTALQLYKSNAGENTDGRMELLTSQKLEKEDAEKELLLMIEANENVYSFKYSFSPGEWKILKDNVDAAFLSTRAAGGFVGCMYAMYATSLGTQSNNTAYYNWFEYSGDDKVYREINSN